MNYDVVVLVEQALTALDAQQVIALHEGIEDPMVYHLMLPIIDAATIVEAGIGSLGFEDAGIAPMNWEHTQQIRHEEHQAAQRDIDAASALFSSLGQQVTATLIEGEPLKPLSDKVTEVNAAEVIIMTRPHVVAEFFHVDWTSRARRKLKVPVLHLIEHENFDEQAEGLQ